MVDEHHELGRGSELDGLFSDPHFNRIFQIIVNTGISADFLNCIIFKEPHAILNPDQYADFNGPEGRINLRNILCSKLKELKTYSDYVRNVVVQHNSFEGSRPVSFENFINEENLNCVRELDRIVGEMKKLADLIRDSDIDLCQLTRLMFEAALLIYGDQYRTDERVRKRFGIV